MTYLSDHLSDSDFADIDRLSMKQSHLIIRLNFTSDDKRQIILHKTQDGLIQNGKIIFIQGMINKDGYQGTIEVSSLDRSSNYSSIIRNGFILSSHTTAVTTTTATNQTSSDRCNDCSIPEVIVSATYRNPYYNADDPFAWLNLFWLMGGDMPKTEYLPLGGGGGGSETIDTEIAENKEKIDAKKYMDCFDNIQDVGATCTITISTDIPIDSRPDQFFDASAGAVGHAFIELWKMSPNGQIVAQNIGFYPTGTFKAASGMNVESKIVDNAFHEYNARYTISVSPAQLRAAINQVRTLEHNAYNLSSFNCTDFALTVFNAAGANLTIPKYQIPAYGSTSGSNTPQGLYKKLMEMGAAGNTGVQTNGAKGYAGTSHGPCN
ncbi:MAG: hypothetical protein ACO1NK_12450 [Sediminibacterium sp.]